MKIIPKLTFLLPIIFVSTAAVLAQTPPPPSMPRKPEARVGTVKVSGGTLLDSAIKRVEPDYPPIAKAAGAGGNVILSFRACRLKSRPF
jgi:hypothetical protein